MLQSNHLRSRNAVPFAALSTNGTGPAVELVMRPPKSAISPLPKLNIGEHALNAFGITDNWKEKIPLVSDATVLKIAGGTVHSIVGIVETEIGEVVRDTLTHTYPQRDGYAIGTHGEIVLPKAEVRLPGKWVHCLLGNDQNYFHFLIMNLGRLGILDRRSLGQAKGILFPKPRTKFQAHLLLLLKKFITNSRTGFPHLVFHEIGLGDAALVDEIIMPWNVADAWGAHKLAIEFLKRCFGMKQASRKDRKLYISRRLCSFRTMDNEVQIIRALASEGFECVELEDMSIVEQIRMFSESRLIVAPHGSGLTNIVFAPAGTAVIEIMPDQLLNWCYRSIAASRGLHYDMILSRSLASGDERPTWAPTRASVDHLMAAITCASVTPDDHVVAVQ